MLYPFSAIMRRNRLRSLSAALALASILPTLEAATLTVTTTGDTISDDGLCSLREAVIAANSNADQSGCAGSGAYGDDTITVPPGLYRLELTGANEDAAATGDLDILAGAGSLTLNGAGADTTLIDGNATDRVFDLDDGANLTLDGVTVQNGYATYDAGGIYAGRSARLTVNHSVIRDNYAARSGGGILSLSATVTIQYSAITGNSAVSVAGGITAVGTSLTLDHVAVSDNQAGTSGGGINMTGSGGIPPAILTLTHCSFAGNTASSGRALRLWDAGNPVTLNISHCLLDDGAPEVYQNGAVNVTRDHTLLSDASLSAAGAGNLNNATIDLDADLIPNAGSPALDAGDNASTGSTTDLAGNQRIVGAAIDIGAYERPATGCPVGDIAYVDPTAGEPGDGASWNSAFHNLQDGLRITPPCQVRVAGGLYKPARTADRSASFVLRNGLAIVGGYPSGGGSADWRANPTILSGDIDANDTAVGGVVQSAGDIAGANSYHVVTGNLLDGSALLDGFIITAGQADGAAYPINEGGGLWLNNASATLTRLHISGNSALYDGGGMMNRFGSPDLSHAIFSGNSAARDGGGLYSKGSSERPALSNVIFSGNSASGNGGGLGNSDSDPQLLNVTFSGNRAGGLGGGVHIETSIDARIGNSLFWNNQDSSGIGTASASFNFSIFSACMISCDIIKL